MMSVVTYQRQKPVESHVSFPSRLPDRYVLCSSYFPRVTCLCPVRLIILCSSYFPCVTCLCPARLIILGLITVTFEQATGLKGQRIPFLCEPEVEWVTVLSGSLYCYLACSVKLAHILGYFPHMYLNTNALFDFVFCAGLLQTWKWYTRCSVISVSM
jgi:hypothetical protein